MSAPDWCLYVDKASGQMQNIGNGSVNGTATPGDEAHYFGQLASDLNSVAELADGIYSTAANKGAIAAGRARVRLLSGGVPYAEVPRITRAMHPLQSRCANG